MKDNVVSPTAAAWPDLGITPTSVESGDPILSLALSRQGEYADAHRAPTRRPEGQAIRKGEIADSKPSPRDAIPGKGFQAMLGHDGQKSP